MKFLVQLFYYSVVLRRQSKTFKGSHFIEYIKAVKDFQGISLFKCFKVKLKHQKNDLKLWQGVSWSNFTWHFHLIEFFGQTPKFKAFDRIIRSTARKEPTDFGSWSKLLLMSFWVILKFWSTAKKELTDFGSWSNVLLAKK